MTRRFHMKAWIAAGALALAATGAAAQDAPAP